MKIFVTGVKDFVGWNFMHFLASQRVGWTPYPFTGDVLDGAQVHAAVKEQKPDAIVNLAGRVDGVSSYHDPNGFSKANVEPISILLDAAARNGVRRFIQVSTIEVYGSGGLPAEDAPLRPESPYASSKACADLLVLAYRGVESVVVRLPLSYGGGDRLTSIVPLFVHKVLAKETIELYGSGLQEREWNHVDDSCLGIALALQHGLAGNVYNIGSGTVLTNLELTSMILKQLGRSTKSITFGPERRGNGWRHACDFTKARLELGYAPEIPFEMGFPGIVEWYKARFT